ncbi:MAG: hypothetical protein L3J07_01895 [Candidatus Magasanikbacteria bacterium]|nr:hypothetical protein [Candidatus Magasanikbacteria bacterium]
MEAVSISSAINSILIIIGILYFTGIALYTFTILVDKSKKFTQRKILKVMILFSIPLFVITFSSISMSSSGASIFIYCSLFILSIFFVITWHKT